MRRLACVSILFAGIVGCASAPAPADAQAPTGQQPPALLVPAGYGTLKQDEASIQLRSGPLLIKVIPLDERVIRLLAPDTYERLRALANSRRADAASRIGGASPELFLVSFFSYQPDVAFQAEDLQLTYQGRILRAAAILPVTAGFGRQRLDQQESQSGIYVFDEPIDYGQPVVVRYGFDQSDDWSRILPRLDLERAKVRARAPG